MLKEKLKGTCSTCKYKNFCGGCRCRAYGVLNDLYESDSYCPLYVEKTYA